MLRCLKLDGDTARKLELDDRICRTCKKEAYITLKDHKPNFSNKPTCRLINPTQPELGKISKQILANIVSVVRDQTQLNQWKNTDSVIKWFCDIQDKKRFCFINFDINDFYPSISEELLLKSINFAKTYTMMISILSYNQENRFCFLKAPPGTNQITLVLILPWEVLMVLSVVRL